MNITLTQMGIFVGAFMVVLVNEKPRLLSKQLY